MGIKRVLKSPFEIAIRKAVEKGLEEDRRHLQERGYGRSPSDYSFAGRRFCGEAKVSDRMFYERLIG